VQIPIRDPADIRRLQECIRRERRTEQADRYRVALLAIQGQETRAIQQALTRSRGFVQRWAYAYRDGGMEALEARPRGGRTATLSVEQQQQFRQRFLAGPTQADGGLCSLRGQDARRILQEEFGQPFSLPGAYKLLHRLKLSCLRPRPRHYKNDPAAMQTWVEATPLLSRPSRRNTRKGG
jgi:transposase